MVLLGVSISHGMGGAEHEAASHDGSDHDASSHDASDHDASGHDMDGHDASGHDFSGHDVSGHDLSGHDASGHDMDGHDVGGHDFSGHDVSGHNLSGHDASGHDFSGHDASGHDVSGHDVSGHDASGHDASGHDAAGHEAAGHDGHDHGAGHDDHALDSNIAVNLNVGTSIESPDAVMIASDKGQKAPLLLLLAGYLMFSGAFGLSFFGLAEINMFLLLGIAFVPPFLFNKALGKIWRKVTRSETYIIPAELPLIGHKVIVSMKVNLDGGIVRIDTPSLPMGSQKIAVMPLNPDKTFERDAVVYICDTALVKGKRFYLVDDDPAEVRRTKRFNV